MKQYNIYDAKTHFSEMIEQVVNQGKSFVIAKSGVPMAGLVPIEEPSRKKFVFGCMEGKITLSPDFFDPLPDEIIQLFEKGVGPS
jgi:antitoxin (DNA-binding transcriptional repressor) of toxin-antitoxin stability system